MPSAEDGLLHTLARRRLAVCGVERRGLRPLKPVAVSLLPTASFAPISFAIKAKENDLLPLEKNRVRLDDDSDDDEEAREGREGPSGTPSAAPAEAPPCVLVEEKRPQLTPEELEAKQGLSGTRPLQGMHRCGHPSASDTATAGRPRVSAGWELRASPCRSQCSSDGRQCLRAGPPCVGGGPVQGCSLQAQMASWVHPHGSRRGHRPSAHGQQRVWPVPQSPPLCSKMAHGPLRGAHHRARSSSLFWLAFVTGLSCVDTSRASGVYKGRSLTTGCLPVETLPRAGVPPPPLKRALLTVRLSLHWLGAPRGGRARPMQWGTPRGPARERRLVPVSERRSQAPGAPAAPGVPGSPATFRL